MIPILYEKTETIYATNGLGRLRDCISCIVTEERNGIYECDFEYPTTGANYDLITLGRIIGVTHDDTGTIQPFDIVSASKPIDGVVTFHAVHISYRLSFQTVTGTSINSLAAAFTLFGNITGTPFSYWTNKTNSGYLASADGIPKSVRSMLGGIEGSVLDAYGGEYEWDRFTVKLWASRGQYRDFAIRYGVNMLDYTEETDASETWSSCIPYWTDGTEVVIGAKQNSGGATITGRDQCIPLDVSDKFEEKPTAAQVEAAARSYMSSNVPYLPTQTINVSFVRLQDMSEYAGFSNLLTCNLCDTIKVIFPDYKTSANFKIVKTVWDVLSDRYDSMELGTLSTTLAEALGISNGTGTGSGVDIKSLLNVFYPVGSYYETSDVSFDPNIEWGGTWQRDSAGCVTVAQDTSQTEFDTVGETGGSKYVQAHTHSVSTQPSFKYPNHQHALLRTQYGITTGSTNRYFASGTTSGGNTANDGGGNCTRTTDVAVGAVSGVTTGSSGNLQPYVVVIRWHRTA